MAFTSRYAGAARYAAARWPVYAFGLGGAFLAGALVAVSGAGRGLLAFVPFGLALMIVAGYFAVASLWVAHRQYGNEDILALFFSQGRIEPVEDVAYLDLGLRAWPAAFSRRMTLGHVIVIDVYNPQVTPSPALFRARRRAPRPVPDPRLSWRDGSLSLLPLPDDSSGVVILHEVASEFAQSGDRNRLLREVRRILAPGGRLLLAERVRTPTTILATGPASWGLRPAAEWGGWLRAAGLHLSSESLLHDIVYCACATKPVETLPHQLRLDLRE
jgi:SAM-dependent methyltransferase